MLSYSRYRKSFRLPLSRIFAGRFKKFCLISLIGSKKLTNQESCVIDGGSTASYFKLEKGACQGDPISAYLFIIALEIIFAMIKSNPNIKGLNIFNHNYFYILRTQMTQYFFQKVKNQLES